MNATTKLVLACAMLSGLPALAQVSNGCPAGSYSVVISPDGTTLSILFDQFTVAASGESKVCRLASPLTLPANHSIGVYKVDYRGFTKIAAKQEANLAVQYFVGPHDNEHGRIFKRKIKGPREGDYLFTETLGAGQMKRVGCGDAAILNVAITLGLQGGPRTDAAMASLDTTDAAPGGALIYHFDLQQCPR